MSVLVITTNVSNYGNSAFYKHLILAMYMSIEFSEFITIMQYLHVYTYICFCSYGMLS